MSDDKNDPGLLSLPGMVRWFRPSLLANAAIRAAISPVFGTFADARASQANVDGFSADDLRLISSRYQYVAENVTGSDGAVWIDYLADTGDGFDSTYAMASLVAADSLQVARRGGEGSHVLPNGRIFILGGDQVYPYPSREEYTNRFVFPFRMAFSDPTPRRLTFVIPGNHDWYDGLNSFDFLFCQARYGIASGVASGIGNLEFPQHRSYFAVRLPGNWWIWGADIQFSQYLDVGQVRYFQAIADQMLARRPEEPEHKVILCIAEPGWQYEHEAAVAALSNLSIVTGLAEQGGAKVCTVLSGDTHHYCRYFSKDLGVNLITAGGGGAYMAPTHQLSDTIEVPWFGEPRSFTLNCRTTARGSATGSSPTPFPSKAQSFWMTWWNLLFPWFNYTFATLLGTLYWLMTWMYAQTPVDRLNCLIKPDGQRDFKLVDRPFVESILVLHPRTCGNLESLGFGAKIQALIEITIQAAISNFLLGIFALALLITCIGYADARRTWKKIVMGTLHWLAHIVAMIVLYIVVSHYGTPFGKCLAELARPFLGNISTLLQTATYMTLMILGGGFVAGFVWGAYLFVCSAVFRRHSDQAFAALRLTDYKNFLRMKIEGEVLTIYPIGLRRTPMRWEWQREGGKKDGRYKPRTGLSPELIDGPIVIDARQVRMRVERPPATVGELT